MAYKGGDPAMVESVLLALSEEDLEQARADGQRALAELDLALRPVVWMLALSTTGFSIQRLSRHLKLFSAGAPQDRYRVKALEPLLRDLQEQGLVETPDGGETWRSDPLLLELASRDAQACGSALSLIHVLTELETHQERWQWGWGRDLSTRFHRIRLAIYREDPGEFWLAVHRFHPSAEEIALVMAVVNNPFDPHWFGRLKAELREPLGAALLAWEQSHLAPPSGVAEILEQHLPAEEMEQGEAQPLSARVVLARHSLLRGDASPGLELADPDVCGASLGALAGWALSCRGEDSEAIDRFNAALRVHRREVEDPSITLPGVGGVVLVMTLVRRGWPADLKLAAQLCKYGQEQFSGVQGRFYADLYLYLHELVEGEPLRPETPGFAGYCRSDDPEWRPEQLLEEVEPSVYLPFVAMAHHWRDPGCAPALLPLLRRTQRLAADSGFGWVEAETSELLGNLGDEEMAHRASALKNELALTTLCGAVSMGQPWERTLDALSRLAEGGEAADVQSRQRLVWFLSQDPDLDLCHAEPRIQKRVANGRWSKGSKITLKRLYEQRELLPFLLPQDQEAAACISEDRRPWEDSGTFNMDHDRTLLALAGHPHLFFTGQPNQPVELVVSAPRLRVEEVNGELHLQVQPRLPDLTDRVQAFRAGLGRVRNKYGQAPAEQEARLERLEEQVERRQVARQLLVLQQEGAARLHVTRFGPAQLKAARLLEREALCVPGEGRPQVERALGSLSQLMEVQSDVGGQALEAREVQGDHRLHLLCSPMGDGLMVRPVVWPLGAAGGYLQPGVGGALVVAQMEGERLQVRRDLADEAARVEALVGECPTLSEASRQRDGTWLLTSAELALQALLELRECGDEVSLSWPLGQALKVHRRTSLRGMKLSLRQKGSWFQADGSLTVSEELVLDMRRLLELVRGSHGTFIPMGRGEYLALTHELRQRLDELAAFSDEQAGALRQSPLAAPFLDELADDVGELTADNFGQGHGHPEKSYS